MAKKITEATRKVDLCEGIVVKMKVERAGQQHPSTGDEVVVRAILMLPMNDDGALIEKLVFEERLYIAENPLYRQWGWEDDVENYRCVARQFVGKKWKDLFNEAFEYLESEMQKLSDALDARRKALENAEK